MTSRIIARATLGVLLWLAPAAAGASQEMLASAKALYESASYEAALLELSAINSKEHEDEVDTYRALCLLGLGRTRDAENALVSLVTRAPFLTLSEEEYSPRIVALFRDVRRRTLPLAAQQLYSAARADFENQNYESAVAGFEQAMRVIAEVDPKDLTSILIDLKQVADGFLTLAQGKIVKEPVPPPVLPPPVPPALVAAAPVPAPKPVVYTVLDAGVTPPVAIEQRVPPWRFPAVGLGRVLRVRLELTIDETGAVENAAITESAWPAYDASLLEAARRWQYQPAVRDGKPVKFRRILDVNIDPNLRPGA